MDILIIIVIVLLGLCALVLFLPLIILFICDLFTSKEEKAFYNKLADGIIESERRKNNWL